jgi:hypothetical protein
MLNRVISKGFGSSDTVFPESSSSSASGGFGGRPAYGNGHSHDYHGNKGGSRREDLSSGWRRQRPPREVGLPVWAAMAPL